MITTATVPTVTLRSLSQGYDQTCATRHGEYRRNARGSLLFVLLVLLIAGAVAVIAVSRAQRRRQYLLANAEDAAYANRHDRLH
ncbi:hypothetical protein [Spirilliplanes yamanashiensis]|uniref:Uncharacterized protein n=1 Tax=Spirilliplanes yamanashiensis TaxID=42233 RepID=A0A8J3Y3S1_9ACTN|nr:hypothetical protein [Spirilliplanes yamanashiensis]GIJ00917.1 hypothetical protein Sya03_02690 [Spirilliplanes yamanashiensis]